MGQIKVIHEHYDSRPMLSLISGLILVALTVLHFVAAKDYTIANVVLHILTVIPMFVLLIYDAIWRRRPVVVVCNDRLEVRMPFKKYRSEILYSDIRNLALQEGQLRIWLDKTSGPSCYNLGANVKNAEDTYNILRATYDQYNQEHGITPVPVESMPERKTGLIQVMIIVTMLAVAVLCLIFKHTH